MKPKNPAAVALGSIRTKKKAEASRRNGKLYGGRPRKEGEVSRVTIYRRKQKLLELLKTKQVPDNLNEWLAQDVKEIGK